MTDFDLDQLGSVWREQPDPAEIEALKRTAATVSRRARWAELFDMIAAVALAGVVVTLVALNPKIDTVLIGTVVLLYLLGANMRQRKLRSVEIKSLTGTVEEMLAQSVDQILARQKRVRLTAILAAPAVLLGLLFAYVIDRSSGGTLLPQVKSGSSVSIILDVVVGVGLVLGAVHLRRSYLRSRDELERLQALRQAYRQEEPSESPE